ncbi:hypothetical protein RvY_01897 [Ramazzottius varieornatus]|uniref:Uncharacterized protein n=1 Tax=Ramazzottius varieornatus TaxID=947166 RepID=A0A1D1UT33_RAMVA|nr:hypothetical protein RvY_01897 [Ramazzottius varieornatus]
MSGMGGCPSVNSSTVALAPGGGTTQCSTRYGSTGSENTGATAKSYNYGWIYRAI